MGDVTAKVVGGSPFCRARAPAPFFTRLFHPPFSVTNQKLNPGGFCSRPVTIASWATWRGRPCQMANTVSGLCCRSWETRNGVHSTRFGAFSNTGSPRAGGTCPPENPRAQGGAITLDRLPIHPAKPIGHAFTHPSRGAGHVFVPRPGVSLRSPPAHFCEPYRGRKHDCVAGVDSLRES